MDFILNTNDWSREVKHHVYVKRQTRICITWPSFSFTCRLLFIISTHKLVVSHNFLSIRIVLSHSRLTENEPVRDFVMYVPTHGRKKPGRQQTLFTNYIHCLLGDPDNLLNNNQLLEMAQDRHQWRKIVVDCSAAEGRWRWRSAVLIFSFSILRNSQLESDVCRLPYTWSLNSLILFPKNFKCFPSWSRGKQN